MAGNPDARLLPKPLQRRSALAGLARATVPGIIADGSAGTKERKFRQHGATGEHLPSSSDSDCRVPVEDSLRGIETIDGSRKAGIDRHLYDDLDNLFP